MKYGDDVAKALGNKLSKIPIPVVDEFVDSNGYLTKVIGKGDLGDYSKILKSDIAKGKNVGKYKKASGAKLKVETTTNSKIPIFHRFK